MSKAGREKGAIEKDAKAIQAEERTLLDKMRVLQNRDAPHTEYAPIHKRIAELTKQRAELREQAATLGYRMNF